MDAILLASFRDEFEKIAGSPAGKLQLARSLTRKPRIKPSDIRAWSKKNPPLGSPPTPRTVPDWHGAGLSPGMSPEEVRRRLMARWGS